MKKFLVVLLALAMVFSIATTAMAKDTQIPDYNDTKTSTEYAVDIYRLTSLGVLCGDAGWGQAYRPEDNITRAEFAKIVCFMYGKQDYVDYYAAQKSAFSDVAEGAWYEGWVNCANDNGLMIGVGGGKFAPEANVSKQEVATATLRGVGYTDELPGDWPQDYIAKSQEVKTWFESLYKDGLTLYQYVQKIDGTAATRAEMAAIVNYCLDLYRVDYVGDQTMVAGVSKEFGVDNDGYMYTDFDTNEEDFFKTYAVGTKYPTLLWDVFDAFVAPEWMYDGWCPMGTLLAEAAGWGYEDFSDELFFCGGGKGMISFADEKKGSDNQPIIFGGRHLPVATDYYIFDQYLDGELWQLGGRYAHLTIKVADFKKAYKEDSRYAGLEAVFAEMLSDVEYDADDNADVYSYDGEEYATNDYDEYAHMPFAIVKEVKKGDIVILDGVDGPNYNFGEYDKDENEYTGEFCILDGCEDHDKLYVFLKDGKFYEDASCLEVNDVVYNAGALNWDSENWKPESSDDRQPIVYLYIAYSPKTATLEEVVYSPDEDDFDEPYYNTSCDDFTLRQAKLDGKDYWFCELEQQSGTALKPQRGAIEPSEPETPTMDADTPHMMSLDGGYTAGSYEPMLYGDDKDADGNAIIGLYDKLTDGDDEVRFVPAYAKNYLATIIFGASAENKKYGVLTNFDPDHIAHWTVGAVDFFGPDGKKTGLTDTDDSVYVKDGSTDNKFPALEQLGMLTNYFLNSEEQVITDTESSLEDDIPVEDLTDEFNWIKFTPGKNDIGYVALGPVPEERLEITTTKGKFDAESAEAINDAVVAMGDDNLVGVDKLTDCESAAGKKITANTVIFEISTKDTDEYESVPSGNMVFKSVKLGDYNNYMDATFTCDQFNIFAWDGINITVLYVVNPSFGADETIGVFDVSRANKEGGFVKNTDNGEQIYFDDNAASGLTDTKYVYAAYKCKDGKLQQCLPEKGEGYEGAPEITAGDFVVLITYKDGWYTDSDDAKDIMIDKLDAAEDGVSDIMSYDEVMDLLNGEGAVAVEITEDTEFINLENGKSFTLKADESIADHSSSLKNKGFILVCDDNFNLIQVILVDGKLLENSGL